MPNLTHTVLSLISLFLLLAACETIKGVGRDIESVGETLEDVVD